MVYILLRYLPNNLDKAIHRTFKPL